MQQPVLSIPHPRPTQTAPLVPTQPYLSYRFSGFAGRAEREDVGALEVGNLVLRAAEDMRGGTGQSNRASEEMLLKKPAQPLCGNKKKQAKGFSCSDPSWRQTAPPLTSYFSPILPSPIKQLDFLRVWVVT